MYSSKEFPTTAKNQKLSELDFLGVLEESSPYNSDLEGTVIDREENFNDEEKHECDQIPQHLLTEPKSSFQRSILDADKHTEKDLPDLEQKNDNNLSSCICSKFPSSKLFIYRFLIN